VPSVSDSAARSSPLTSARRTGCAPVSGSCRARTAVPASPHRGVTRVEASRRYQPQRGATVATDSPRGCDRPQLGESRPSLVARGTYADAGKCHVCVLLVTGSDLEPLLTVGFRFKGRRVNVRSLRGPHWPEASHQTDCPCIRASIRHLVRLILPGLHPPLPLSSDQSVPGLSLPPRTAGDGQCAERAQTG
jgi:hypothetical protein